VRRAIADANARALALGNRCTVAHFSVQFDHIHLIVEAADRAALLRGIRALAIRIARRVNRLVFRRGCLFAERWHGRALTTPRAVRHALVYVLANYKKHALTKAPLPATDPCSSAPYFEGFSDRDRDQALDTGPPVAAPRTWLLRKGWLRHGAVSVHESPRS
jgi:REP element-mobilizing transposase RayT